MNVVTAIVLYAIVWFMTLFVVLPMRLQSQDEAGARVAGTHGSAPENPQLRKRFIVTTAIALVIWGILVAIILTGAITVADIDLFNRFGLGAR